MLFIIRKKKMLFIINKYLFRFLGRDVTNEIDF